MEIYFPTDFQSIIDRIDTVDLLKDGDAAERFLKSL